ncbi:schlafen-like protein 2 [Lepeophtheirus salmonis]|uniref:Putative LOC101860387 [Aplysia californica] n=1 Tax=Lepeophtheirus salmonis TaxID=72036 RepID=A0A0K2U8H0_LEPSM
MELGRKFYIRHSILKEEEDITHEFKGHRVLHFEEDGRNGRDANGRKTRQYISKYLCGMLNSGKGGRLYIGVLDNGQIEGVMLTRYQKDHILTSLEDIFERFEPPLHFSLYSVSFVPVLEDNEIEEGIKDGYKYWDENQRGYPHKIRTHSYCWCDLESQAALMSGLINPFYVVEIQLKSITNLKVPYRAEDGAYYIRRNAFNECIDYSELIKELECR